jgi:hypothetical protein
MPSVHFSAALLYCYTGTHPLAAKASRPSKSRNRSKYPPLKHRMTFTSHFTSIQNLAAGQFRTWTLPTILGKMLTELETRYGSRDPSWTLLGVEFGQDGPQNWFPLYPNGGKFVLIELFYNALHDMEIACYQLAHECVHLLAPNGGGGAPVIEEGLATMYSEDYVKTNFDKTGFTNMVSYIEAAALVRELESTSPEAIRNLRKIEPSFKNMTRETFAQAQVNVPTGLIEQLLAPFNRV